jgi:hypothetical protein
MKRSKNSRNGSLRRNQIFSSPNTLRNHEIINVKKPLVPRSSLEEKDRVGRERKKKQSLVEDDACKR